MQVLNVSRWRLSDVSAYQGERRTGAETNPVYIHVRDSMAAGGVRLELLSPAASQKLRNHSPTGFEWGYGGSGPAQLALALLLDFTGGDAEFALQHYEEFKRCCVARWESPTWVLPAGELADWLRLAEGRCPTPREPGGDLDRELAPEELAALKLVGKVETGAAMLARMKDQPARHRARRGRQPKGGRR